MNINSKILFFDTETTGILKDEKGNITSNGDLIQLAYRELDSGVKTDGNMFFNTDTEIEIGAIAVHNIYKKLLIEKTNGEYINDKDRAELSNVFNENILVAHNLDFDLDVLDNSGINYGDKLIDTLKVAKVLWSEGVLFNSNGKEPEYVNQQYLRFFFELYEITDSDGNKECTTAHDAFGDVVVLENIFYKLFEIIKNKLSITDDEVIEKMKAMTAKEFILIKTMRIGKYRGKTFEEVADIDRGYLQWIVGADFTPDIKYTCQVWLGEIEDEKFFN
ncbi:MAG: 3'-5' exonuclease [Candidatus Gracilibacteria bacterium]